MKDSEIIEAAKNGVIMKGLRICFAIASVNEANTNQRCLLIGWIAEMLGDEPYYESWMTANHPELCKTMTRKDFIQARLAWMDWMIEQCRKEEAK